MFIGAVKNIFPIVTIISSFIIIVTGVFKENKDAMIAGTTVAGIAGTAYNASNGTAYNASNGTEDNENVSTTLRKKRREPPGMGGSTE